MKKCIFAGTFDPPTLGHADTICSAAEIFDEVVVAIMINPQKTPFFSLEERREMLAILCKKIPNVRIVEWEGVAVDLLEREQTNFYVRGIRNTVDLEYENAAYFASRKLNDKMVTIYLPAKQELLHISSTLVKNSIKFGKPIQDCVGKDVAEYIEKVLKERTEQCLKSN